MTWKIIIHPLYISTKSINSSTLHIKDNSFSNISLGFPKKSLVHPNHDQPSSSSAQGANRRRGPSGASPNDPTDRRWRRCATGRGHDSQWESLQTSMIHSNCLSTNSDYIYIYIIQKHTLHSNWTSPIKGGEKNGTSTINGGNVHCHVWLPEGNHEPTVILNTGVKNQY